MKRNKNILTSTCAFILGKLDDIKTPCPAAVITERDKNDMFAIIRDNNEIVPRAIKLILPRPSYYSRTLRTSTSPVYNYILYTNFKKKAIIS